MHCLHQMHWTSHYLLPHDENHWIVYNLKYVAELDAVQ